MYNLKVKNYTFRFRDLTWLDETDSPNYVEVLSRVTIAVDKTLPDGTTKTVDTDAKGVYTALMALPQDFRDKAWIAYKATLPDDRQWGILGDLWVPPEPRVVETTELTEEDQDVK